MPTDTPPPRFRLVGEFNRYTSPLDETRVLLRTTSDGNLLEEESGDWLVLDKPPHDAEDRELESQSPTQVSKYPTVVYRNQRTAPPASTILAHGNHWLVSSRTSGPAQTDRRPRA
jgi:hypothetical protein